MEKDVKRTEGPKASTVDRLTTDSESIPVEKAALCEDQHGKGSRWYVAKTKPREEKVGLLEMNRKGIETLCPMTREFRLRRRQNEVVPLFPGYLFVRFVFPDQYDVVRWSRGISCLVRFGDGLPPALDENVVRFFVEKMDAEGIINTSPDLIPGQNVFFLSEPLRGLVGTVLRCDKGHDRVHVLMDLLYHATVEVDVYQVKPL
jgi:transcriptional antiterminator RfaH